MDKQIKDRLGLTPEADVEKLKVTNEALREQEALEIMCEKFQEFIQYLDMKKNEGFHVNDPIYKALRSKYRFIPTHSNVAALSELVRLEDERARRAKELEAEAAEQAARKRQKEIQDLYALAVGEVQAEDDMKLQMRINAVFHEVLKDNGLESHYEAFLRNMGVAAARNN